MSGMLRLGFLFLGPAGQRELDAVVQAGPANQAAIDPVPRLIGKGVVWKFDPKDQGNFSSSPLVVGDRIYQAAFHKANFSAFGALYCVDRKTGNVIWRFDDDGEMKAVFSSPCVADGRLYIGEGFHQDSECKLYCIEEATGKKVGDFPTASHTESSHRVCNG